jgi:hypothetical protein
MSAVADVMNTWYTVAIAAALVLAVGVFHSRTRLAAFVVLTSSVALAGFGYFFAAPRYEEVHTACMFFAIGAISTPFILAADWWWWGVLWKLLRQLNGERDAV